MTTHIRLPYGQIEMTFDLPPFCQELNTAKVPVKMSPEKFAVDLEPYIKGIGPGNRVAVAVADKTRLCQYDLYLPILLQGLLEKGVARSDITIYIAYGTHQVQSDEDSFKIYGDAWHEYKFVHHDCRDRALFCDFGTTDRGTPVRLRKDICDVDVLITFGAVSHHYFAGYGGGRKLIFPGLGEEEAIYHNHALFLDHKTQRPARGCVAGKLWGNPLAEDLAEIEAFRPADLAVHGILDSCGRVCRFYFGAGRSVFKAACNEHASYTEVADPAGYDMVLASAGGFPKDINFIQSHKAIHNGAGFVKDGGTLLILAQCRDGIGSATFLPWFKFKSMGETFEQLTKNYQGNGGTALAMMEKLSRINIMMVTDLDRDLCRKIGVGTISYEKADKLVKTNRNRMAVIPNAALLVRAARQD